MPIRTWFVIGVPSVMIRGVWATLLPIARTNTVVGLARALADVGWPGQALRSAALRHRHDAHVVVPSVAPSDDVAATYRTAWARATAPTALSGGSSSGWCSGRALKPSARSSPTKPIA